MQRPNIGAWYNGRALVSKTNDVGSIPSAPAKHWGVAQRLVRSADNRNTEVRLFSSQPDIGLSFNSRTIDFESMNLGAIPSGPARDVVVNLKVRYWSVKPGKWEHYPHIHPNSPHRQLVKSSGFHPDTAGA